MNKKFTWVETHKDIVEWLKDKEDKQQEMIELLKDAGVDVKDLNAIDPFTFFNFIHRQGKERLKILQQIAELKNFSYPNDIAGLPTVNRFIVLMFNRKKGKVKEQIALLWQFFYEILNDAVKEDTFSKVKKITGKGESYARLTDDMFFVAPEKYLPIDSKTTYYIQNYLGLDYHFEAYSEYLKVIEQVHQKDTRPFYEISEYAHYYTVFSKVKNELEPKIFDNFIRLLRKFFDELKIQKGDSKIDLIASTREKKLYCKIGGIYCLSAYSKSENYRYGAVATENFSDDEPDIFERYGLFFNLLKSHEPIEQNWDKVLTAASKLYEKINPTKHDDNHNPYFEDLVFNDLPIIKNQPKTQNKHNYPLNFILYGPPGTGKTYHTIKIAAEIIENKPIDSYDEARKIFNEHLGERIRFITFHQSYSYQDFVQGIIPNVDNQNSLTFKQEDGIFLQIAIDALFEYYKLAKKKDSATGKPDPEEVYLDFIEYIKTNNITEFETKTGKKAKLIEINNQNTFILKPENGSRTYRVTAKSLLKLFKEYPDIEKITNIDKDIKKVLGGAYYSYYWTILKAFIEFYNNYKPENDETGENLEDLEITEKKKRLNNADLYELRKINRYAVPNYVLIIDEINRANISNVFGELITLLEPDKRSHGDNPLIATLPSSGDQLVVPSNLYIIGTMNTADKSIALLDVALRRRFVFKPMYPQYDLQDLNDVEVLKTINEKILREKGKDFQIGHSYFLGKDGDYDFEQVMNQKVIPLLLEYFMNDEDKVREILQEALKHKPGYVLADSKDEKYKWLPLQIVKE